MRDVEDLRYGIIAAPAKGITIVALLCSEPDRVLAKHENMMLILG
jgi:hypothetical protein